MDERVKALLDQIRGAASCAAAGAADGARAAGRKAGQMVDVAKLNVQLFDLNGEYNDVLRQLGQVMVDTHRGLEPKSAVVTGLLIQADEKSGKITELKSRITDLKQSQNCPGCGESCGKHDKFCRCCGARL